MSQQAGVDIVRIELSEPLAAVPNGFTIQSPPRVAIDLPGVGNAMGRNAIELNQGNLRSANIAQAGDRARVVLNLRQASNYQARLDGNALVIALGSEKTAQAAGQPVHFAQSLNTSPQALRDIDF
ncbi:AMIN domain-containing protein, partial [Escherichia coli]|uniref:AMIN domain-containing protein n=1 Tax=Escherichia coli TaxID=562 RepID=UPI00192A41CB